jgi:RimJ/RimL family protein N-acetyltransferase
MLRIGAREEVRPPAHGDVGGRLRDTVYFSILDSEWPGVKADGAKLKS